MKKTALLLLLLIPSFLFSQSCLPEGIIFTAQEQIDNFQINYPNCTEIEGYVEIQGGGITNLDGLNVINSFGNTLTINITDNLVSLEGLENVTSIAIHLQIFDNVALSSLEGLENLTSIGAALLIWGNLGLTSLEGLDNLTSVGSIMTISNNAVLSSLEGLENLTTVEGDLLIEQNPSLTSLDGLESLTSIIGLGGFPPFGGSLTIADNISLSSLTSLINLTSIDGDLYIQGNNALSSLVGLDNIEANSIYHLWIWENPSLSTCEVQSVCDYLLAPNGQILITANSNGCNSMEEVEQACGSIYNITDPAENELIISGESDTIRWETSQVGNQIKLEYSEDNGNTYTLIEEDILSESQEYIWEVPDNILTSKARVHIVDQSKDDELAISDKFHIKPYLLTKLDENNELVGYDINQDRWGFSNLWSDMWPPTHYNNIDYSGIDIHTQKPYDHRQAPVFATAKSSDYTPWEDFVDAFTTNACYRNVTTGIYHPQALARWKNSKEAWGGSCFAIAVSDALAFSEKESFANVYTLFPAFNNPISLTTNSGVIRSMARMYSHCYGFPSQKHWIDERKQTTPADVVSELKEIFSQKNVKPKTISFFHWLNKGAHTVLPYKLRQDPVDEDIFYIDIYDNQYPNDLNAYIKVDVSTPPFPSTWEYSNFPNWGGNGKKNNLILDLDADVYLSPCKLLNKGKGSDFQIYALEDELQIGATKDANIVIRDVIGNSTGYTSDSIWHEIEGSLPLIIPTGGLSIPYGYHLPWDEYSVTLDNFISDTVSAYFYTGNMAYNYDRTSATGDQSDCLSFGDGLSVVNPDLESRMVKLEMIIGEESRDKLFRLDSLPLNSLDSVQIQTPDQNYVNMYNYGSSKTYQVELNSFSYEAFERFKHKNIPIAENTLHIHDINWTDVDESILYIYVDEGMTGSYEDTLILNNQTAGIYEENEFFNADIIKVNVTPNPVFKIAHFNFTIYQPGRVAIRIYDVNGSEVATPVIEVLESGEQSIPFDLTNIPSGLYFYRITAAKMTSSGKILLLN